MMTAFEREAIRARCEAATPGPWKWDIRTATRLVLLVTAHSGQYYVMGFERWGTQGACPTFQQYENYIGPVDKRRSRGMVRADKLAKSYPGKEHHQGFDDFINHPDAVFIANAPQDMTALLNSLDDMETDRDLQKNRAEALEKAVRYLCDFGGNCWDVCKCRKAGGDICAKCFNREYFVFDADKFWEGGEDSV